VEASTARQAFSAKDFRNAVGGFATGVTVVTTRGEDEHAYGMTANAFSSVSLDPPLVLVCVMTGAEGAEHIRRNRCFAVNILAADQEPVSRYFSSKDRPRGRDAFRDIPHRFEASGAPIIDEAVSYLDCSLHVTLQAGDHDIFIGEVLALGVKPDADPLLFHGGGYRFLGRIEDPPG
jgi:flavin reductase (DIM6/NTAB) family NADH-FMN oxidoreductase RutF